MDEHQITDRLARFRVGGYAYPALATQENFGKRAEVQAVNGGGNEVQTDITNWINPFYGGEWWLLPEEDWLRATADTKDAAECDVLRAIPLLPTDMAETLAKLKNKEAVRFRIVTARPGSAEPLLGVSAELITLEDVKMSPDGVVQNLRLTVKAFGTLRSLVMRDSKGWWLLPDFIEQRHSAGTTATVSASSTSANTKVNASMSANVTVKQGTTTDVNRSSANKIDIGTMTIPQAIETLQRQLKYEEETVEIMEPVDGSPWDAAHALALVFKEKFGWASAEPTMGFFGPEPPALIAVEVGVGKTINIPWGTFKVPGIDGKISATTTKRNGKTIFQLHAIVKRKHEQAVKDIAIGIREVLKTQSIYRGKALKMSFPTEGPGRGTGLPMPTFLDVSKATEGRLVFSDDVERAIRTNLFTPVERYDMLGGLHIPFKRGVLLAGKYGTGKTEIAFTVGKSATDRNITFCYCEQAKDLPEMLRFAAQYAPAVVFCEDIDRVTSGERDADLDDILNTIDGIEAKGSEILVVLTTNNVEKIHPGMIRPGRLDAVIEVKRPDGPAVERLLALYARGKMAPEQDLTGIGGILAGQTPAIIREVVERSKLAALKDTQPGEQILLTAKALEESAKTMRMQIDLLERGENPTVSKNEALGLALVKAVKGSTEAEDESDDE